ncbi:MAG: cytochrome c [Alphaproteobacteria bacterium]|nr:cytochrome c [Alphaproteobacteria bacterium]
MRVWICAVVAGLALSAGGVLASAALTPQQIVDERVAGMKALGGNMKGARTATDAAGAKAEIAKAIAFTETMQSRFPKGTGIGDAGVTKSRALPDIWTKPDQFKAAIEALSSALKTADAAAGDQAKFDAAFGALGKSCKGCHDQFRGPEVP